MSAFTSDFRCECCGDTFPALVKRADADVGAVCLDCHGRLQVARVQLARRCVLPHEELDAMPINIIGCYKGKCGDNKRKETA